MFDHASCPPRPPLSLLDESVWSAAVAPSEEACDIPASTLTAELRAFYLGASGLHDAFLASGVATMLSTARVGSSLNLLCRAKVASVHDHVCSQYAHVLYLFLTVVRNCGLGPGGVTGIGYERRAVHALIDRMCAHQGVPDDLSAFFAQSMALYDCVMPPFAVRARATDQRAKPWTPRDGLWEALADRRMAPIFHACMGYMLSVVESATGRPSHADLVPALRLPAPGLADGASAPFDGSLPTDGLAIRQLQAFLGDGGVPAHALSADDFLSLAMPFDVTHSAFPRRAPAAKLCPFAS